MTGKNLFIIIIIFCTLLIISFFVVKKDNSTWARGHFANKTPVLKKFDVNKVKKFRIVNKNAKMEILSGNDGIWTVYNKFNYPADFEKIRKFMLKIKNMNIAQKVLINQDKLSALHLLNPEDPSSDKAGTGTLLDLYDASGNLINSILFGKFHYAGQSAEKAAIQQPAKDGRFLLVDSNEIPLLISSPFLDATPEPALWLDKSFINLSCIKSAARIDTDGKILWKISRKDKKSPFAIEGLKKGEIPLPRKMFQITSAFRKFDFNDVLKKDTPDSVTGFDNPGIFIYETCEGAEYKITISMKNKKAYLKISILKENDKKPDKNQLKPDTFYTKWIYEIPRYTAKNLLLEYDDLVRKQQAPVTIMGQ
jgi:hypothetical protein